ncbi:High-affinity branched-chain amino acid transport ATP-binding protein LivF [Gemmata obscuriglobus]|uniref:ABC transporter ATP-binding protein n=1 Tax=Gemmata obscuriglobus TaxID=114 RepID=UPI00016C4DB8|nr:ABC transporter ATP-binding protein [Gemmata obscuriglobus]QEG31756.1 High-affinity branched-chain amino acid transport ATP-binding protein LivF [Gemmata obscuriglobus]VTS11102.1 amino acid abc transporter atpase : ABC transporter related protein OS=Pirellula staleyi (strain ATCC 27377 / DSM 6068 / ICPB 4128) GN=Psta_4551 PE=3 SV=1: ABC_tran [Gemmata obscuriglobus UQM 2246]
MSAPLLEVRDLEAGYGPINVLHRLSLTVNPGEIVTMIGANGAGKTTTLNAVSGVVKTRAGSVTFDGKPLAGVPAHNIVRLGLAQSPEGRKIFARLTVRENLEMGAFTRADADGVRADIKKAYSMFPILEKRQAQPGGLLSGGEQQMLAIARALMSRPKLLLLDEPSLGLAPQIVVQIFDVIRTLNREQGMSVLLVEQNARMALKVAHRGYVLETGRITCTDRADVLLHDPRIREAYLGE